MGASFARRRQTADRVCSGASLITLIRRLPPGICLTPSVCSLLHSTPLRWPVTLLRSVPQPESGADRPGGCSHPLARFAYRLVGTCSTTSDEYIASATALNWKSLSSAGWHERSGQVLRCSFLRACELGLTSFLSHKSHYVHSRPSAGTRWRRTPGARVPAVSRLHPPAGRCGSHSDGPIE